jgi:hypothetical protein
MRCGCPGCIVQKQLDVNTAMSVDATKLANALTPLFKGYDVTVTKKGDGQFSVTLTIDSSAVAPMGANGQPMMSTNDLIPSDSALASTAAKSDLVVSATVNTGEVLSESPSSGAATLSITFLLLSIVVLANFYY